MCSPLMLYKFDFHYSPPKPTSHPPPPPPSPQKKKHSRQHIHDNQRNKTKQNKTHQKTEPQITNQQFHNNKNEIKFETLVKNLQVWIGVDWSPPPPQPCHYQNKIRCFINSKTNANDCGFLPRNFPSFSHFVFF